MPQNAALFENNEVIADAISSIIKTVTVEGLTERVTLEQRPKAGGKKTRWISDGNVPSGGNIRW